MGIQVNVDTFSGVYHFEYTSDQTRRYFDDAISSVILIGEKTPAELDSTVADSLAQQLARLTDLAQGFQPGTTNPLDMPMNAGMARVVDSLIKSLRATGATVGVGITDSISVDQLKQWHDLYLQGMKDVLVAGAKYGGSGATRTLQSMVELEYVRTGNEQIFGELSGLKDALTLTKSAISLLSDLQNFKNKISAGTNASGAGVAAAPYENGTIATVKNQDLAGQYKDNLAIYFSGRAGIGVQLSGPIGTPAQFIAAQNALAAQGNALSTKLGALIKQIELVIPRNANQSTLTDKLDQIKTDIDSKGPDNWIRDNYNDYSISGGGKSDTNKGGDYQRNLTQAVQTAETLNDTQNTDLKTAMFNFEEFYKSASALMTMLNRIVEKMGSKIS